MRRNSIAATGASTAVGFRSESTKGPEISLQPSNFKAHVLAARARGARFEDDDLRLKRGSARCVVSLGGAVFIGTRHRLQP